MWTKKLYDEITHSFRGPTLFLAGFDDWRLPMKMLYSLIHFDGNTGMSQAENDPFINSD
jgi:hypothetical protein